MLHYFPGDENRIVYFFLTQPVSDVCKLFIIVSTHKIAQFKKKKIFFAEVVLAPAPTP